MEPTHPDLPLQQRLHAASHRRYRTPSKRSQPGAPPGASPRLPSSSCSPHPFGRQYAHPPTAPPCRSQPSRLPYSHPWAEPDRRPHTECLRPRPQGTADRRAREHLRPGHASHGMLPDAVTSTLRNNLDRPERHDLQRHHRHMAPAGRHTQATGRDIVRNQPGLQLRRRRMSSHCLLQSKPINLRRKKIGWR